MATINLEYIAGFCSEKINKYSLNWEDYFLGTPCNLQLTMGNNTSYNDSFWYADKQIILNIVHKTHKENHPYIPYLYIIKPTSNVIINRTVQIAGMEIKRQIKFPLSLSAEKIFIGEKTISKRNFTKHKAITEFLDYCPHYYYCPTCHINFGSNKVKTNINIKFYDNNCIITNLFCDTCNKYLGELCVLKGDYIKNNYGESIYNFHNTLNHTQYFVTNCDINVNSFFGDVNNPARGSGKHCRTIIEKETKPLKKGRVSPTNIKYKNEVCGDSSAISYFTFVELQHNNLIIPELVYYGEKQFEINIYNECFHNLPPKNLKINDGNLVRGGFFLPEIKPNYVEEFGIAGYDIYTIKNPYMNIYSF